MAPFDFSAQSIVSLLSMIAIFGIMALCRMVVRRSAPIGLSPSTFMSRPHGGVCLGAAALLFGVGALFVWVGIGQTSLPGQIFCYTIATGLLAGVLVLAHATDRRYAVIWDDHFVEGPAQLLTLWPERHRIAVTDIAKVTRASARHWVATAHDGREIAWSTLHCGGRFLVLTLLVHANQDFDSVD